MEKEREREELRIIIAAENRGGGENGINTKEGKEGKVVVVVVARKETKLTYSKNVRRSQLPLPFLPLLAEARFRVFSFSKREMKTRAAQQNVVNSRSPVSQELG